MKTILRPQFITPSLIALALLIVVTALVSPLDKTLGERVRIVYVHGAIIRVVLGLFVLSGVLGAVCVIVDHTTLFDRAKALFEAGLVLWFVYVGISVVATLQTWGGIPWFEPRWVFTLQMTGLAPMAYAAGIALKNRRLAAALYALTTILMLFLLSQARLVLHPIDPIGESGNSSIQLAYLIMLLWWVLVGVQVVRGRWALAVARQPQFKDSINPGDRAVKA